MATAKQIQARKRFKEVVAEAKKLRAKNPKLSQAQAVKQAWAIEYSVAGKTKTKKQVRSVGSLSQGSLAKKLNDYLDDITINFLRETISACRDLGYDKKQAYSAISFIINDIKNKIGDAIDYIYEN